MLAGSGAEDVTVAVAVGPVSSIVSSSGLLSVVSFLVAPGEIADTGAKHLK